MKQIQPPFQGLATVTEEYTQILLTFFKTKLDGNLQQKWPCSAKCYHSRQLVGSIKQEDLS